MINTASMFRVKRACGHVELVPELLPREQEETFPDHETLLAAREKVLCALERMMCLNCYSRDDINSLVDELRSLGVRLQSAPTMIGGTERQTRLARLLRSRKVAEIRDRYCQLRESLDARTKAGLISQQQADRQRSWCERSIADVLSIRDPEWWIMQEQRSGWDLVRNAARRHRAHSYQVT